MELNDSNFNPSGVTAALPAGQHSNSQRAQRATSVVLDPPDALLNSSIHLGDTFEPGFVYKNVRLNLNLLPGSIDTRIVRHNLNSSPSYMRTQAQFHAFDPSLSFQMPVTTHTAFGAPLIRPSAIDSGPQSGVFGRDVRCRTLQPWASRLIAPT